MSDDSSESAWNIDGYEHTYLFQIKIEISKDLRAWNLENAYWNLRTFWQELDAKFNRTTNKIIPILESEMEKWEKEKKDRKESEKAQTNRLMKELQEFHDTFVKLTKPSDEEKSRFFYMLEAFYMHLCFLMKVHGMYYRDSDSNQKPAVLRR